MSGYPLIPGTAVVVGVGGLGSPGALALADAGVERLVLVDDDVVDVTNLHRQILFRDDDVGRHKLDAAADALVARGYPRQRLTLVRDRFVPETAAALVAEADVLLEGADNFATKFLAADAAHLGGRPVVHGAALRWVGTAWAVAAGGEPCYRCLFEDLPGEAPSCATAGVVGPLVGLVGALMADLALEVLQGGSSRYGVITSVDGRRDRVRAAAVTARSTCALCGSASTIHDLREVRYTGRVPVVDEAVAS